MPRQLPPELLLQLARYGDWTGVVKLQRVSKGMCALLANDANPEQNLIWRHCVQDRWDWVRQDDDAWWSRQEWLATLGNWRRVYAYLRSVGFVARASQYEEQREGPFSPRTPSLRVSEGQWRSDQVLSLVEECAASEEPLAEAPSRDPALRGFTTAYVRPGYLRGDSVWKVELTLLAPRGVLLGVETEYGRCSYFDIGDCIGTGLLRGDAILIDETGPMWPEEAWYPHLAPDESPTRGPARLCLVVDLRERMLWLNGVWPSGSMWRVSELGPGLWQAGDRVRVFVAFPREPRRSQNFGEENEWLYGDPIWDNIHWWDAHLGRRGPDAHALLHSIYPVPNSRAPTSRAITN